MGNIIGRKSQSYEFPTIVGQSDEPYYEQEVEINKPSNNKWFGKLFNSNYRSSYSSLHSELHKVTSKDFGISMSIFFAISLAIFFTFLFARNSKYKNYFRNNSRNKLDYVLKSSEYETRSEYPSHVNMWVAIIYLFIGIIISVGLHFILINMHRLTYYIIYSSILLCYCGIATGIFHYPYKKKHTKTETVDESGRVIKTDYYP